jgi:4-diphosphocytidyl-2-C-methyl-D-erythritol kinase
LERISLKAPAKINLYLNVFGKRSDGFHEIETLMQAVDLFDEISLASSEDLEFSCDDPELPQDSSNLALKAALALREKVYFPGAKIFLKKNIPYGAGLGGGSSDAAFVLRGLIGLYNLKINTADLLSLAASIGSDVPFFLSNGQALARGRGEIIEPVSMPLNYHVLLIVPPIPLATAGIYADLKKSLTSTNGNVLLSKKLDEPRFMRSIERFHNDLETAALSQAPELGVLRRYLQEAGCFFCSMSGSGSAFYGLFSENISNLKNEEVLKERNYKIFTVRPILLPLI